MYTEKREEQLKDHPVDVVKDLTDQLVADRVRVAEVYRGHDQPGQPAAVRLEREIKSKNAN